MTADPAGPRATRPERPRRPGRQGAAERASLRPLRLLSYNIKSMRQDTAALTRVIRGCRPDVVCVQEAPRFAMWRARRRSLARRCGLAVAAGARRAGLAVFATPAARVLHREYHLLSRLAGLYRRGLALAVLEIGEARFVTANTHLDLVSGPRYLHAAEVLDLVERARRRFRLPVVLAGDINEEPGGATWNLLADRFQDAHAAAPSGAAATFSAREPRARIDGVFAESGIRVLGCGVPEDPGLSDDYPAATDHRPVLAELQFPGRARAVPPPER